MSMKARLVWNLGASLGEGPAWFAQEGALRFVDIKRGRLHRYLPASGDRETIDIGGQPSFVLPARDGRLVVGSGRGIRALSANGTPLGTLCDIGMPDHNRTNDATVDCHGRLWLGTMDDHEQIASGAFYCFDRGRLSHVGGEAVVTNGPAVRRDGRVIYRVDSGNRRIWRHTIGEGGRLDVGELFLQLGAADGYPDGIVLDAEDCLWVAMWDGWSVRRYAPDGRLLLSVALPCARVTKIAFGGPDLRTAYVTTARVGLSTAALAEQPLAGGLFAFDAPVAGNLLPDISLAQDQA